VSRVIRIKKKRYQGYKKRINRIERNGSLCDLDFVSRSSIEQSSNAGALEENYM